MIDFCNKLKQLRTIKGLSQEKLAGRINVTKSMISAYENSVRLPSYEVLTKIALFFNVSIDYLFGFDNRKSLDITDLTENQVAILSDLISEFKKEKRE